MKKHKKFKFVARMLLNAWLLALLAKWITLPASAAPPPNSTAVTVYGQSGDFTTNDANKGGAGINATNLNGPAGVVLDTSGNLYVADSLNNRVLYYLNGSATATRVYGQAGDLTTGDPNHNGLSAGSLSGPQGVALDSSGNLYVADTGNHRVLRYPAGFTTPDRVYGQGGSYTSNDANNGGAISADTLKSPNGLSLDSSGNLYVADFSNNRVLRYPAGGTTADRVYGQGGDFTTGDANKGGVSGNSLKSPIGVALNADGGLFVADVSNNRVLGYPAGGTTATMVYGQGGSFTTTTNNKDGMNGNSLSLPFAVVVAGGGNLFVADMNNNRVLCYPAGSTTASRVYGQGGDFTTGTVNQGGISANSLKAPAALALDNSGSLYVSDQQNNRVLEYALPVAANGVYGQGGSFTTRNDGGGANATKNSLSYPSTTALDSNGNVYVVDQNNNRVLYYPAGSTTATRVYGQGGSFTTGGPNKGGISADSLNYPTGIALDGGGNLYVSDANNNRVLFYPSGGTTATRVYGQGGSFTSDTANNGGTGANSLESPGGVALDGGGNLYVADTSNNRVLYYPSGSTTATRVYGQSGHLDTGGTNDWTGLSADSLWNPDGIALDRSGNLYVADSSNNRVLYFASGSTTATRVYGQGGAFNTNNANKGGSSADSLDSPTGVALDGDGNLYVADWNNSRGLYFAAGDSNPTTADLVYGQGGSFTTNTANMGGVSATSLYRPSGMTVAGGSLYVTDNWNNRVLKYDLPSVATPDTSAPAVSAFSATTPSTSFDIPITAFTSTDNVGATGYLITTTSTQPSAGAAGWSTYAPATYTVAANGNYTLYPWAKDRAGNVSAVYGSPLAVLVARPIPNRTVSYHGNGSTGGMVPIDTGSPYPSGATVTVLGNTGTLVKTGYNFNGWNTAAAGGGMAYTAADTFIINADTILYAQWGIPGNSLSFDGVNDYVTIADANDLDMTINYTLELWFKADSFGTGGVPGSLRGLISKYQTGGANGYFVRLSGNELDFDGMTTSGLNLQSGTWYHVAAVNDNGARHLYLNGAEQAWSGTPFNVQANNNELTLGTEYLSDHSRFFDGTMDEVRIWNVARSRADIQANKNRELTGTESGLVAYYNFNGFTGTNSLADVTGKGRTGTLINDPTWGTSTFPMDWILTATAGDHGTIAPAGDVTVPSGGTQNFHITPATCYHVADVTKNSVSVGAVTDYSWTNVTADGTIHATFAPDLSANGTPHWWLAQYGWTTNYDAAEAADTDGDGMSNFAEYAFGLDPTKGSSVDPIIDTPALQGAGQFSYTRAANSILTYTVWTSTDLSDWGAAPAAATQLPRVPAVDGVETVDVTLSGYSPPPGGKLFVRVKAAL